MFEMIRIALLLVVFASLAAGASPTEKARVHRTKKGLQTATDAGAYAAGSVVVGAAKGMEVVKDGTVNTFEAVGDQLGSALRGVKGLFGGGKKKDDKLQPAEQRALRRR